MGGGVAFSYVKLSWNSCCTQLYNQSPTRNESILALGSFGVYEMKLDEDRVGF